VHRRGMAAVVPRRGRGRAPTCSHKSLPCSRMFAVKVIFFYRADPAGMKEIFERAFAAFVYDNFS